MKWEKCILIASKITGQDKLHNDIKENIEVQTVYGRFTPFNETDLNMEGRAVTKNSRKVVIRKPLLAVKPCEKVKIGGLPYDIKEKTAAGRFSFFYIERTGAD